MNHSLPLILVLAVLILGGSNIDASRKKFNIDTMYAKFNGRFPSLNYLVFLDGDNIRGKSGFLMGKEDLLKRATNWSKVMKNTQNLVLIYDHGPQYAAHLLKEEGIAIIFSGPGRTADDVIAGAIKWCQLHESHAIVVTADSGLKSRCKKNAKPSCNCEVVTLDSNTFIDMLDSIGEEDRNVHVQSGNSDIDIYMTNHLWNSNHGDDKIESTLEQIDFNEVKGTKENIDAQVALARKRLSLQNQLTSLNKLISNNRGKKKTKKLKLRRDELNRRLHRISHREYITSERISSNPDNDYLASYLKGKHEELKVSKERREEETWERVVLAERLHYDLIQRSLVLTEEAITTKDENGPHSIQLPAQRSKTPTSTYDGSGKVAYSFNENKNDDERDQRLGSMELIGIKERQVLHKNEEYDKWSYSMLKYCVHVNSEEGLKSD